MKIRIFLTGTAAHVLTLAAVSLTALFGQTAQTGAATAPQRPPGFSDSGATSGTANLPAQPIGPTDLISIAVYDAPEFTRTVRVAADGRVALPLMKHPIQAAGLMPSELEVTLAEALRDQNLINEATVIVTVAEYNSRPITVTGAVRIPLTFQVVGKVRLMDAITRAGGLAPEAGSEVIISEPNSATPSPLRRIQLKPLMDSNDPDLNVELTGNQEIRVPAAGRIFVMGDVRTQGAFAVQDQSDTSVLKMLTLAGGLAGPAPKQAWIVREDDSKAKHQISIQLKDMVNRKAPDVPMMAHDILFVPDSKTHQAFDTLAKILAVGAGGAIIANVIK